MIDIIVLFFLTQHIGKLAGTKGKSPTQWKLITIMAWFVGAFFGCLMAILFLGIKNPMSLQDPSNFKHMITISLIYYPCAIAGYHIVRTILRNQPDSSTPS